MEPDRANQGQGFGPPVFTMVIMAEMDFVESDSDVAVIVTVLPSGIESGAR